MEAFQGAYIWTALTLVCVATMCVHYRFTREGSVARRATVARNLWPRLDGADGARYMTFASSGSFDGMRDVFVADERLSRTASRNFHGNLNTNRAHHRQASLPGLQDLAGRSAASGTARALNTLSASGDMEQYFICATGPTLEGIVGAGTVTTPKDDVRGQRPTQRSTEAYSS